MSLCLIALNWSRSILGEDSQPSLFWCFSFTVVVVLITVVCMWRLHHTTDISHPAHLSKFSQSVLSNQISTLLSKQERKHTANDCSCSNIVTCDLWLAQRETVVNDQDTKSGEQGAQPCGLSPTPKHRRKQQRLYCAFFYTSCRAAAFGLWQISLHTQKTPPTIANYFWKQDNYLKPTWGNPRKGIIYTNTLNKHDYEQWLLSRNQTKGRLSNEFFIS